MAMTIRNEAEIEKMRVAGRLVGEIHVRLREAIAPGVTTAELDRIAAETLAEHGATSSFLGYRGYPASICTSVNDEIVHGIPGPRRLREGDIISIDVGAIVDGYHGDSAWTYPVGQISEEAARLLRDTEAALDRAIAAAKTGNRLGAIGAAVERFAIPRGYGVIREYGGHGIGRSMHEDPHVPNHGQPERGPLLRTGLTLAIEPMLTSGGEATRELDDGWTVVTADGSLAAHFEHTVAIGPDGGVILTQRPVGVVY
jgi:methionyl aminopeptidase